MDSDGEQGLTAFPVCHGVRRRRLRPMTRWTLVPRAGRVNENLDSRRRCSGGTMAAGSGDANSRAGRVRMRPVRGQRRTLLRDTAQARAGYLYPNTAA